MTSGSCSSIDETKTADDLRAAAEALAGLPHIRCAAPPLAKCWRVVGVQTSVLRRSEVSDGRSYKTWTFGPDQRWQGGCRSSLRQATERWLAKLCRQALGLEAR